MARTFKTYEHCSLSLSALVSPQPKDVRVTPRRMARTLSLASEDEDVPDELVRVVIEDATKKQIEDAMGDVSEDEELVKLTTDSYAATLSLASLRALVRAEREDMRVDSKKRSRARLNRVVRDMELVVGSPARRQVRETGRGVFIGVVDSGFDLTHPAFRGADGKLRVESLLVQRETARGRDREFTTSQLEAELAGGANPAADADGHGTHVAAIAAGSKYRNLEGVAPDARLILVKTNFIDTDKAVSWIFSQADATPCVINLSIGHHWGAHDGSDPEERLYERLTGPKRIIVVSAGNERTDSLHIGGRFVAGETRTVAFDAQQPDDGSKPEVVLTLWFAPDDDFDFTLISPAGQEFAVPSTNHGLDDSASGATIKLLRGKFRPNGLVQVQIQVLFRAKRPSAKRMKNWRLRCACNAAVVGRLDGWFSNSGYAVFRPHPLVEEGRTIGLPATSRGCIAVASHVSKTKWKSDRGDQSDSESVVGRSSSFSSLGPTLDGREKPEISAPGQYVTAALADGSELQDDDDRSLDDQRVATIEGTSMAAPAITGVIALMLQRKHNLTLAQVQSIFSQTAHKDAHTGAGGWNPTFGYGKVDVAKALSKV